MSVDAPVRDNDGQSGDSDHPAKDSDHHGRQLHWLLMAIAAAGAVITAVAQVAAQLELNSPLERPLSVVGAVVAALGALAWLLVARFAKHRELRSALFWTIVASIVGVVSLVALMILTHDPIDLVADQPLRGEVEAGAAVVHRFAAEDAQTVLIRVTALTPGLELAAVAERGRWVIPLGQVADDTWEAETVVVGGVWDLTIRSQGAAGRYRARLVQESGRVVEVGSDLPNERLVHARDSNGYAFGTEQPGDVAVVTERGTPDLDLDAVVYRDGSRITLPVDPDAERQELAVSVDPDASFVIAVQSPSGRAGRYRLLMAEGEAVPMGGAAPQVTPVPEDEAVRLPDVYDLSQAQAETELLERGIPVQAVPVCSDSMAEDRVRQAFVLDEDGTEAPVVDRAGVVAPNGSVAGGETVYLKVATGEPCE